VYLLARDDVVTLSGQTQGILNVLVLGAATDYALLIVARFREELRRSSNRFEAMRVAWRASVEPIVASAGTVVLGMLCLLLSEMAGNRSLGPIAATGILAALVVTLTLLPAVLALLGRSVFWPFRPRYGTGSAARSGVWGRIARLLGRRPRLIWVLTAMVLGIAALGVVRLDANGIPQSEAFLVEVDSKSGQKLLAEHYPGGSGSPAIVIADADQLATVVDTAESVDGVESVAPYPPGGVPPKVVDGLVRVDVTLSDEADSAAASDTVRRLRVGLHSVDGARAKVGGFTAVDVDTQDTSRRDRDVIIPLVLVVVFGVLVMLLRSLVAPLLLVATVVLSFFATMGVSGVVFRDVLGWPGTDSALPLYAFVFLVALGIDYNIFLMTRVREETAISGTRAGTLTGLAVTGGVITSAGAVLAATFSALAVLPLMFLAQIAFMVSFGVLLDTLVVRSLLVPALTVDVGRRVWWPSALARGAP
ncbi:MAG: MMPL family transporter, partial [Micromonosporaceae bacterium]